MLRPALTRTRASKRQSVPPAHDGKNIDFCQTIKDSLVHAMKSKIGFQCRVPSDSRCHGTASAGVPWLGFWSSWGPQIDLLLRKIFLLSGGPNDHRAGDALRD